MTGIAAIEPLLTSEGNRLLEVLVVDFVARASAFAAQLNPVLRSSVGNLLRSMNCHYSNLSKVRLGFPAEIVDRWLPRLYPASSR